MLFFNGLEGFLHGLLGSTGSLKRLLKFSNVLHD